ncbi:MAG: tetratricopeptide repeat protein [Gammaproteobacteria bacterium]|nr:tetratricopeptide repeat protein [Gammaproteobacteria bacterium]MCW8840919.1 tetratricopeptide repeat protein [Gammaproteobacteria bacterium]MCW8927845.1 tetratricopeptide repeat protein [Gammaproteobacteria bacterium]MCW8958561.1 tetratricopeptide repeat protein [Gammaproteobacteria bacterium]MCW8972733.1 tetratricopeptide repeat protein [Gammaproteobacteria bacterium]
MEIYNSEQDQVEALKAWWDKHGRTVIAAIVVVLLSVLGWKSWQGHQEQRAESAAVAYQQMMDAIAVAPEQAMEAGRGIVGEYPGTTYATMASLTMGRLAVEQGELEAAAAHLRAAAGQARQQELKLLAQLRLSRVLMAQGRPDEALTQLQGVEAGSLQAAFDEQRGDILLAQGDRAGARDAYTNAMAGFAEIPAKQELVQLKLNDLAESKGE